MVDSGSGDVDVFARFWPLVALAFDELAPDESLVALLAFTFVVCAFDVDETDDGGGVRARPFPFRSARRSDEVFAAASYLLS